MQDLVGVDCEGQVVSGDGGFDDGINGNSRNNLVGLLELLERMQSFRGELRRLSEVEVERSDSRVRRENISRCHEWKNGEGGAVVSGCEVCLKQSFIVKDLQAVGALAEDAEDVSRKTEIPMPSGSIQDIDTHSGWGV